jgi:hypothetical protein
VCSHFHGVSRGEEPSHSVIGARLGIGARFGIGAHLGSYSDPTDPTNAYMILRTPIDPTDPTELYI